MSATWFVLDPYLAYSSTLKMKGIYSSETSVEGTISQKTELLIKIK
jgi:hypothetical protein